MSSEFPFIGAMRDIVAGDLPLFQEYAWDFERDRFLYDASGRHILLTGNPALEVWIYKALKTERRRVVTECLMVNPYIKSIDSFSITPENRAELVRVHITLTTVYGEVEINV